MKHLAAALCGLFLLTGCGYRSGSLMPEGVERVAVDVFENDTFYREIEFTLTREIQRELRHRTSLQLVTRPRADAVLTGRIVDVFRPTLIETTGDLVSEQGVVVTVAARLVSTRDGRVIMETVQRNRAEFVVERGETLESAFAEALFDVAELIVNRLQDESFRRDLDAMRGISSEESRPVIGNSESEIGGGVPPIRSRNASGTLPRRARPAPPEILPPVLPQKGAAGSESSPDEGEEGGSR